MKEKSPLDFFIAGGLGNQLFMLCAGLYYAEKFGRRVTFDISDLERVSILHPGLNVYQLGLMQKNQISKGSSSRKILKTPTLLSRVATKIVRKSERLFSKKSYQVEEIGFIDFGLITPKTKRVEGYFQSWRYFSGLTLKPELSIRSLVKPTEWFIAELKQRQKKDFAAFHIRRGDYSHSANRSNGILSGEYFQKISTLLPADIELLIFTDSPDQVSVELNEIERGFRIMNPPSDSDPVESLLLMAQASYIAISNSTFSWWSATLASEETVIFAPEKWFELRDDPVDLIPNRWIKVRSEWVKQ